MKPPIPFPGPAAPPVPIVGQLFTVKAWFSTVLLVCNCDAQAPLLLVGPSVTPCPSCGRGYQAQQITFNAATGETNINVGVRAPQESIPS
jgi:hypothetical protein